MYSEFSLLWIFCPVISKKEAACVVIVAKGDEFAITSNESMAHAALRPHAACRLQEAVLTPLAWNHNLQSVLQRLNIFIKFLRMSGCLTLSGLWNLESSPTLGFAAAIKYLHCSDTVTDGKFYQEPRWFLVPCMSHILILSVDSSVGNSGIWIRWRHACISS